VPRRPHAVGTREERFEELLFDLTTRFINVRPEDVDREIEDALRRVCQFLAIDVAVLWQRTSASTVAMVPTHTYPPLTAPQAFDPLREDAFPWTVAQMRAGRPVVASRLADLPDDAAVDRDNARLIGIVSNVTLPLVVGGAPGVGAVAFNCLTQPRTWTEAVVRRLQLVGQIFGNALARQRDDAALRIGANRLEAAADLAGLAFYEIDYEHVLAYVDDRFRSLYGLPPDREEGLQPVEFWMERLHPDDRPRISEVRQQLNDGRVERLSEEYRFLHPLHGERWIHHIARVATRDAAGRVLRTFGVFRDITARRQAEESLRRSYAEIERLRDRLQAETDYLRAEIGDALSQSEVTGKSAVLQAVLRDVQQVALTDSTVLVRGETGTGKELIARAIHRLSARRHHVMVKVNCGALPSGLVESELFGREKGAFTGALARQVGRFEMADGSTLFLDEVGELPPDVQVKLLRVLQEGEFERLGSPRTIKVNVRVIAATNRDLAEDVRKGRFREDLYYRLNVFPIRVPPLRERAEDIPLLVWTFLEEFSSRMGKKITQVPRKAMDALVRHPWPGNVRELRNVIEHAAILTAGETLRVPMPGDLGQGAALPQTLADVERDHILRTLEATGWRIKGPGGAAAVLGLNPATLYSRMNKLAIRRARG
jgi:formate hydrogenlyase transcriptional activator